MFNDSNDLKKPETYVKGFNTMTNNDLFDFLGNNRLSFSINQMLYIQSYFKSVKRMFPTYQQIFFFDEINKIHRSRKKGYSISSVSSDGSSESIMEACKDLLEKQSFINKKIVGAMPISFASRIASEYLSYIGCAENKNIFSPSKDIDSAEYFVHSDDNAPIFSYSQAPIIEKATTSNPHNTLVMLCPANSDMSYQEYCLRAEEFSALSEISSATSEHTVIKPPFGMFEPLMKHTSGILVNIANIPEIEKNEEGKIDNLNLIFSSCIGRHFFATNNNSVGILNRIAEGYSLRAVIFAIKNNSSAFSFESIKHPEFSFHFSFLQNILNFTEEKEYVFGNEKEVPFDSKKKIYLTDNRNGQKQTYNAEKTFYFNNGIATATSRLLNESPFKSSALAVLDAINALIAKGASKEAVSLSIQYSLICGTDNHKELGKNLAAILGAYRSMVELCVSDNTPQIDYNENQRSIAVLASAKTPKRQINSAFSNGSTSLYFYQIEYDENGLPDYKKYRDFIKLFYLMIEEDHILSAFAINENISAVLQSASLDTTLSFDANYNGKSMENAHGILFEISKIIDISDRITRIGETIEKY